MKGELKSQLRCGPTEVRRLQDGVERFGFSSIDKAIDRELLEALRVEAADHRRGASQARETQKVAYRASVAGLGQVATSFLECESATELLQFVFKARFVLTREASCYTYYECGDFLGLHRDRETECAVTLIVYLDVRAAQIPSAHTGLQLRVYSPGDDENLMVRLVIPACTGTLVIGSGSQTWHERPTLQKGEFLAALTACFRRAD
jgi:hypothetical protein